MGYADLGECPYLPDRTWSIIGASCVRLPAAEFGELLDQGFRRMGEYLYAPRCTMCQECVPLRIPVKRYRWSKSERRVLRRNQDVTLEIGDPFFTAEKLDLYTRFLAARYPDKQKVPSQAEYTHSFVYQMGFTQEFRYLVEGRLVGLGVIDVVPNATSSVYFYFDPRESKRSLGTFSVLKEIEYCQQTGRDYVYLGYWVKDCKAMNYKAQYHPHERRDAAGRWILFE